MKLFDRTKWVFVLLLLLAGGFALWRLEGPEAEFTRLGTVVSSELVQRVTATLSNRAARQSTATHARHAEAMRLALGALETGLDEIEAGLDRTELAAEHLRIAIRRLDSLIGRIDVEMVLGEIFSRFCLGK